MLRPLTACVLALFLGSVLVLGACGDDEAGAPSPQDASLPEASLPDASTPDASSNDASVPDARAEGVTLLHSHFAEINAGVVDAVVIPNYQRLATQLEALHTAASALKTEPTQGTLQAARQAWRDAHDTWSQCEAFAFGPVQRSYADMDSWPVNESDLDATVLNNGPFTAGSIEALPSTQKGLHAAEYILFSFALEDLGSSRLDFAVAITQALSTMGAQVPADWTQGGPNQATPYRTLVVEAGKPNNVTYPDVVAASDAIFSGIVSALESLADSNIQDPYDTKDSHLAQSRFSRDSTSCFTNVMRGVESSYVGHRPGEPAKGISFSDALREFDPALDARVLAELAAANTALGLIPAPFEANVDKPEAADEIEAALAALRKLHATLKDDVRPLLIAYAGP